MKCARLRLQERSKSRPRSAKQQTDKPRRYCQKRMVNPEHEEDPRWLDVFERFYCQNDDNKRLNEICDSSRINQDEEDLYLTVQNLKFEGNVQQGKRPRTSFKYKTIPDGQKHRMFVKQMVDDQENDDEDRSSQLTCYYFDDYVKYILNTDRSRPASGKSTIFLQGLTTKLKENKSIQVDIKQNADAKKTYKSETKPKCKHKGDVKRDAEITKTKDDDNNTDGTKIAFYKSGKRKSLTISRTQSPETIQVIRVDVVCNYNGSSLNSDSDDVKTQTANPSVEKNIENVNIKGSHFANKYLLTNTIKTLDENLSGGAKVTLLCKTFRLSDRNKLLDKKCVKNVKNKAKTKTY